MTPAEAAAFLRRYNEWRRTDDRYGMPYPDPREIGVAIDAAIEMIERLEAAEKSDAESLAMYRKARDERDALRAENEALAANLRGKRSTTGATYAHLIEERDALRANVERMEKIESAAQNLVKMKGRHNTEIAYRRLVAALEESK